MQIINEPLITGQTILIGLYASLVTGQPVLSYIIGTLYLTTMLYWGPFTQNSIMRNANIFTAVACILKISLHNSLWFCCGYRGIWLTSIGISTTVYGLNELIFYCQTNLLHADNYQSKSENYKYFSLAYTWPNSDHRNTCVQRNLIVHGLFLHVLPAFTYAWCALQSDYYSKFIYPSG